MGGRCCWYIEDSSGTQLQAGTSHSIEDELALLSPGEYRVVWLLTTDDGYRTWVDRAFTIPQ